MSPRRAAAAAAAASCAAERLRCAGEGTKFASGLVRGSSSGSELQSLAGSRGERSASPASRRRPNNRAGTCKERAG